MDKEDLNASDLENLWKAWNVQVAVLISLFLQLCLVTVASLRQRSPGIVVVISVWSAYVLANWAADFGLGRISPSDPDSHDYDPSLNQLMALWAPFFLLQFAGTDTITAFALPDNQLWLRQIPGFLGQVIACIYVFTKALSKNMLLLPTFLIFAAAIIKYVERTRALYLAATSPLLKRDTESALEWLKGEGEQPLNGDSGMRREEITTELKEVKISYHLYNIIRACFIYTKESMKKKEMEDSFKRLKKCQGLRMTPRETLRVMEIQLQLIYGMFYTKIPILRDMLGRVLRLVSFSLIAVALGVFTSLEKKNIGNNIDLVLSYTLLWVALCFDTGSLLFMLFSEQIVTSDFYDEAQEKTRSFSAKVYKPYEHFVIQPLLFLRRQKWSKRTKEPYRGFTELSTPLLFRKWRGTMSGFNLMKSCVDESSRSKRVLKARTLSLSYKIAGFLGAGEFSGMSIHQFENPFLLEVWELILREIKPLELPVTLDKFTLINLDPQGNLWLEKDRPFGEMLIVWHVATDLFFVDDDPNKHVGSGVAAGVVSRILSDYMLYLLILVPDMMSEVARIAEDLFKSTCDDAITLLKSKAHHDEEEGVIFSRKNKEKEDNRDEWKDFCQNLAKNGKILKNDDLWHDAWVLYNKLKPLENKKWEIIGKAWVQMLSFAAVKCRTTSHVEQLSKGGEFLSLVWLLVIYKHAPGVEIEVNDP